MVVADPADVRVQPRLPGPVTHLAGELGQVLRVAGLLSRGQLAPVEALQPLLTAHLARASRAYPWDTLVKQSPVVDHVHGTPLLVAVGPDGKSFRVFISRIDGKDAEFFLKGESEGQSKTETKTDTKSETSAAMKPDPPAEAKAAPPASVDAKPDASAATKAPPPATPKAWTLLDTATASEWNFQGCAVSGLSQGKCLDRVPALKDYWFDWRNYHPDTTIYKH